MEEPQYPKQALDKFRQWHFWWLVVFSFLLIVTFVYFLPTRFLHQFQNAPDHHGETPVVDENQPHGHDSSGNSIPNEGGQMMDADMHEHMDEHMSAGMDMDEMIGHMMEMHDMTEEEASQMMSEMMGHEHEEGTDHEHTSATPAPSTDQGQSASEHAPSLYREEAEVKDGLAVNLNISPVPYNVGVLLSMDFFVSQKPGNVPVLASQLQLEHEKLMHVIGVRSDMNEFFHVHPDYLADNPAIFSIDYRFNKPGLYKLWSSIKKDGADYVYGHPEVNVNGAGSREDKKVSLSRNVITGNYQVSLVASDNIVQNREVDLSFDIHSLTGQEITVENYLGAKMHLVLIKDDWKQFIHTHPGGAAHEHSSIFINTAQAQSDGHTDHTHGTEGGDEVIAFTVNFPEAGLYKAFAQFRPQGTDLPEDEALTAEFWFQVEEKAALPISQWWLLLIVSVPLIAGLSWLVNRYLKVKPEDVKVNLK